MTSNQEINPSNDTQNTSQLLLSRQPIYDAKNEIVGFQLQYQDGHTLQLTSKKIDDKIAARTLLNAFTCANDKLLIEHGSIFISVTPNLLFTGLLLSLPPEQVILDLHTDAEQIHQAFTDEQLDTLKQYQKYKFRFAITLDEHNLIPNGNKPLLHSPYLALVDFIGLDIQSLGLAPFAKLLRQLRHHLNQKQHQSIRFIATKVNTHKQLNQARATGADWIQGHYLCRPALVIGHQLSFKQSNSLQLVAELQNPDISAKRIAELIGQTPTWSYRLLRLINSVAFELSRPIESIEQAVIYLGQEMVCHWVSLMVLAQGADKPQALVLSTLIRAKMSTLLAKTLAPEHQSSAFLVGLFSTLDAMLDLPINQALEPLPLADEINHALINHQGILGEICAAVVAYEQGQFTQAKNTLAMPNYQVFIAYSEAVIWAKGVCQQLSL